MENENRLKYQFGRTTSKQRCLTCGELLSKENEQDLRIGYHVGSYACILKTKGIKIDRLVWDIESARRKRK